MGIQQFIHYLAAWNNDCWRFRGLRGQTPFCALIKTFSLLANYQQIPAQPPFRDTFLGPEGVSWIEVPMYSKVKGSSFTSQVGFNFLPSITTKQSVKLYSRLELTYIEKCILPYKSFCLVSKTFKVENKNKQTNKKQGKTFWLLFASYMYPYDSSCSNFG